MVIAPCFISEERRCHILSQLDDLESRRAAVQKERQLTCTLKHDERGMANGEHYAHENEEMVLRRQIRVLEDLLNSSQIYTPPTSCSHVSLGSIVKVRRTDDDRGRNEHYTFHIVGFDESDPTAEPQRVSYTTPIAQLLINAKQGETVSGTIGGIDKEYVIEEIMLPGADGSQAELPLMRPVPSSKA